MPDGQGGKKPSILSEYYDFYRKCSITPSTLSGFSSVPLRFPDPITPNRFTASSRNTGVVQEDRYGPVIPYQNSIFHFIRK